MGITSREDTQARFERTMALLQNLEAPFTAEAIYALSDLAGEQLTAFRSLWANLPVERRRQLITRLVDTAETNFELDFSSIIHPALDDPDTEVRVSAVEGVLEEAPNSIIERLMRLAQNDPFSEVRAAAARALGQFVLKGELGKLPDALNLRLQDTVLALYRNIHEDLDVRRRALEAAGNCGREGVADLIREAYYADEMSMRVSAVFAMGRSCDDDAWAAIVLDELSSDHPEMRYEAARAAGELELRRALPRLSELAFEDDREIQEMAIWSLGEIGGTAASKVLNQLAELAEESDDDELADAVAEAQGVAALAGDDLLPLFDFSELNDEMDDDDLLLERLDTEDFDDLDDLDDIDDLDDLIDDDQFDV